MKKRFLWMCAMLLSLNVAFAQRTITGTVTGANKETLIGASVVAKGTTVGTVTDTDGKFSLNVPQAVSALVISFTGYTSKEVAVDASTTTIDVNLEEGSALSEVVVVGYGTQQKRTITGTVASVKGSEITEISSLQSFDQALQGKAVGVNISIPNGVLNNPPVFRVRGISSITLSSTPLIVIDGIPTFSGDLSQNSAANNPLSNINPNDIESMEILKDASAAAIYGSRAVAGVVLVTTKRGKKGKTKLEYNGSFGMTDPTRLPSVLNATQFVDIKNEARKNANIAVDQVAFFLDTLNGAQVDTKWSDYIYRIGTSSNHNLSLSGGTDQTSYYLALGYTDQQGMIVANEFKRKTARLNLDHKVSKFFKIGGTLGYSNNYNKAPNTGSLSGQAFNSSGIARIAFNLAPIVSPYKADGSYNINTANQINQGKNKVGLQWQNPMPLIDLNRFTSESDQVQTAVYAQADIATGLYVRTMYGIDRFMGDNQSFATPLHGDGFSTNGSATNVNVTYNRWDWQNIIGYDVTLAKEHNISVLLGGEQQYTKSNTWGATRTGLADPFFTSYQGTYTTIAPGGNSQGENYLLSYFGRLNYDMNRKILLTLNLRQDEFSPLAEGKKKGVFWGVSGGITPSEFDFWKNAGLNKALSFFRLRGSYGTVGNVQGLGDYPAAGLYNFGLYGNTPTAYFSQSGNPNLSWETGKKSDVGVNFGLFDDKLTGEITYFNNLIDGLILNVPQAPSKGIPNNVLAVNTGSMETKGWEFGIGGTIFKNNTFKWTSNINLALMSNEILSLGTGATDIAGITAGLESTNVTRVGQSVGSLFVVETAGVNPQNGRRVFVEKASQKQVQYDHSAVSKWTYVSDGSIAPAISLAKDGIIMGPTLPTYFGAWENTFSAYGFDLTVQVQYSGGNYIYNGSKAGLRDQRVWNNSTDVLNRWRSVGDVTDIPKVIWGDNVSNGSGLQISENVEKGDFVRIRNISLGYTVPKAWIEKTKFETARFYLNLNNYFLFTKYTGTDPEISTNGNNNLTPGIDRNTAPMARTIVIGLRLGI
jgi:TonB-dependent starch-binding outer membrane protein SusC